MTFHVDFKQTLKNDTVSSSLDFPQFRQTYKMSSETFRLWLWHIEPLRSHFVFLDTVCLCCVYVCVFLFSVHITHTPLLFYFSLFFSFPLFLYFLSLSLSLSWSAFLLLSLFHLFLFSSLTCYTFSSFLSFPLCLFVCLFVQISLQFFSLCLFVDVGDEEEAGPLRRFQNSRERCKFLAPSISVSVPEDDPYHSDEEYYEHPLFSPEWTRSGSRPPGQAAAFRQIEGEPSHGSSLPFSPPLFFLSSLFPSTSFFSSASTPLSLLLSLSLSGPPLPVFCLRCVVLTLTEACLVGVVSVFVPCSLQVIWILCNFCAVQ